jgi:SAM-dependent methyltransferase
VTVAVETSVYDHPKYYDLLFGSDWKAEFDFLRGCFERHAARRVRRLFEPACGTGRLLVRLAQAGYSVAGNDLNPHAVAYCNARFVRHGLKPPAVVGDMSDFRLARPVDAAFNTINSFRHLATERAAESHLRCVARALAPGGLYLLGLHLTPTVGPRCERESWSARRGNLAVNSTMWSEGIDLKRRVERVKLAFDVYTPTSHVRLVEDMPYRTYTAAQMRNLIRKVPQFETVAAYDFCYDLEAPTTIGPETEDVVYVLRRR